MKEIIFGPRASTVLYNFIKSNHRKGTYLLPGNVCPVVILVFLKAGCEIEICDIDERTLCIDEQRVMEKLNNGQEKYAGVFLVRTYGSTQDFSLFFQQIKTVDPNLLVIDDKCLSIPEFADEDNNVDLVLYSTGYAKYTETGYGEYGLIIKDKGSYRRFGFGDQKMGQAAVKHFFERMMKEFVMAMESKSTYQYVDCDWLDLSDTADFDKYRNQVIRLTKTMTSQKIILNDYFYKNLPSEICLEADFQNWWFNILVPGKELLLKKIFDEGLFSSFHYHPIVIGSEKAEPVIANQLYQSVVNLFNNQKVSIDYAQRVCRIINEHLMAS